MQTNQIAWRDLLRSLANQQCVLLLGPDLAPDDDVFQGLLRHLDINPNDIAGTLPRDIRMAYPGENLFLFQNDATRIRTWRRFEAYYEHCYQRLHPLYARIARLPFPVVINTMPDLGLRRCFDEDGILHQFSYYDYSGTPEPHDRIQSPPRELRLLFNLLGVLNDHNSLVLTHDDLFRYFSQILGDKKLSSPLYIELSHALKQATDFVFLGFQFDHWPMQMLLRLLNPERYKGLQYAVNPGVAEHTRVFFADQFEVEFVDEMTPAQFLEELCTRWEEEELQRRKAGAPLKQTLRDWLRQGLLERILQELRQTAAATEADLQMSRLSTLRQSIREGVVNSESIFLELNRIRKAVQDIIETLP